MTEKLPDGTPEQRLAALVEEHDNLSANCVVRAAEIYRDIYRLCDSLNWQMPVLKILK